MPPANAPIPTTEPTAARGNMSLASVYTLADQAWCAAAATLTSNTAVHMLPASGARTVGTIRSAIASIVVLRARLTVHPRLIRELESHPPPIEPTSATTYTTMSGSATCASLIPYRASRNFGSQYRESQRMSQRNPSEPVAMKAHGQPHVSAIQGTRRGVMIAPVFVPALKMPVASARSLFGNHSATALMAPGKFADSATPSRARAAENRAVVRANAWAMAARLHAITAAANPRRTPIRSNSRPAARNANA